MATTLEMPYGHGSVTWIEPSITAISDCWVAYRNLNAEGYMNRTVNHIIRFVDDHTGAHTNPVASTWHHVKAFPIPYNRKGHYIHHLANYMSAARCREEKLDQFTKFLHLVAAIDWSKCPTTSESKVNKMQWYYRLNKTIFARYKYLN